ncbi:Uncharacterised protein [Legionella lansingensis]|uniref:Uncharacterized protein n=1 Tax=Legionella lansingensis TaxID=45067 RepID=A0A0W0W0M0_9GAMM|nr:hypothetical protein [Legionella lansingensis]KTD25795.1 hypothetical protein Llan_0064 [Legionella lansingensis]SNV52199.1 Uncharacterised protein [Legionella lansingensis]
MTKSAFETIPTHKTVFIPLPIYDKDELWRREWRAKFQLLLQKLDKEKQEKFASNFDFTKLSELLTNFFRGRTFQVGESFKEAEDIVNQHSHYSYFIIVKVRIPLDRLGARASASPNIYRNEYLWLKENTAFTASDIVSARPMELYTNTKKMLHLTESELLWPEKLIVVNPKAVKFLYPQSSSTLEIDQSKFSSEQLQNIQDVINQLNKEINSRWPYPNKHIKQEKVDALEELIELSKTKEIDEAIHLIEEKYKNVRSGKISTRTAALLDDLKSQVSVGLNQG